MKEKNLFHNSQKAETLQESIDTLEDMISNLEDVCSNDVEFPSMYD